MEYPTDDLAPVHLRDHLRILKKNKWTAVLFFCLVVGMTSLYLLFTEPTYSAKVVMVLNPPPFSPLTMMSELVYSQGVDVVSRRLYVTTQFDVLKSRRIAEQVLDRLDLWDEYHLGEEKRSPFGPGPRTVTRESASETLAKQVQVNSPNIMSNSIELTVKNRSPERAARIANALVDVYLETLYIDRDRKIRENLDWLRKEFNQIEEEVLKSDQALQDFKKKTKTISVDDRENILNQKLNAINASLVQARIARIVAENSYEDAKELSKDPTHLEHAATILASNPQVAALQGQLNIARTEHARIRDRYKEKHPRMIELRTTIQELETRIRTEVLDAIETLRINYELALSQEDALIVELADVKEEVIRLGEERIQYLQLLDESLVNRTIFDSLLNRLKETKILLSFENPLETIQIIDKAIPQDKPAGFRPYFLPVAAAVGLILGIFLCYVRDYFDDTIRNERDAQESLNMPLLAILPFCRQSRSRAGGPLATSLLQAPVRPFAEFMQRLTGIVQHVTQKEDRKILLVTSACPGEGKTTLVGNLGIALAQQGHKVLLVDGNFQGPSLHDLFPAEDSRGIAGLLEGGGDPLEAVRETGVANLYCLPAGPSLSTPSVSLESPRAAEILDGLKQGFDRILLDSAALLECSETSCLARRADAVLWVISSGETSREKAIWAKKSLTLLDSRILGIVLNNVRFLRGS